MENIFEKGCLVQLSSSVWQAKRKIKPDQLAGTSVSPEWLSATKKLVDPDSLKPISKVVNAARSYLARVSLPFPIQGMVFVPKEMISKVDGNLNHHKTDFDQEVEGFTEKYERLREVATMYLGELFNEFDYPPDIRRKFSFVWRFVILDLPNGNTRLLAPEVYEREKCKFIQTMEEARELAIQSLREEFSEMVQRITERFASGPDGKTKIFKNATVHNFYEFFQTFKDRNIFRDDQLAELVERAQGILGNQSADTIRVNDNLKDRIKEGMQTVETAMSEILSMPRRKIIMN